MRRNPNESPAFAARISRDEKQILDNLLPMQGGRKWAVETALEHFIELCESNKALQSWVHDRILDSRMQEPPRGAEAIQPKIRPDLFDRFNKMFGEKGGTSWFLRRFVTAYIDVNERRGILPEDGIREAVKKMLEVRE